MKCQNLFSGANKKNIINSLSAKFAHGVLSLKGLLEFMVKFRMKTFQLVINCYIYLLF